jgi:hypothetical protein
MSCESGPNIITKGLILHLDAADKKSYVGSGTLWNNRCGKKDKGTLTNAPVYNAANGGFLQFNNNTFIAIPNDTIYNTQTPTIIVWVKTNNTNQQGVWFEKGNPTKQYSLLQENANINWRIEIGGNTTNLTVATATYMNTSNWYQVAGTYSSGFKRLYINGVLVNSASNSGSISTDAGGVTVGARGGGGGTNYNGNLAICKLYNRVLSAEEIQQNFNSTKSRFGLL